MWDTSQRLLRLLALLQGRRDWNAEQIASVLQVTERTVRRDVARLRDLGYPIATVHGIGGGYQLEAGATLPPLMFDADEAVATVLALRDWAASGHPDTGEGALSALDKTGQGNAAAAAPDLAGALRPLQQPRPGGSDHQPGRARPGRQLGPASPRLPRRTPGHLRLPPP